MKRITALRDVKSKLKLQVNGFISGRISRSACKVSTENGSNQFFWVFQFTFKAALSRQGVNTVLFAAISFAAIRRHTG